MKQAVTGIINKIPATDASHTHGWARVWADNLGIELNDHDEKVSEVAFIDHGVNFSGGLNLMGGWQPEQTKRIDKLKDTPVIYSLDIDMPDYASMIEKRKSGFEPALQRKLVRQLRQIQDRAQTLVSTDLNRDWLAIGDSHTAAVSRPGSMVIKKSGSTLNGQINRGFEFVFTHIEKCDNLKGVTLCFGNIDVRFHLLRLDADWRSMWRQFADLGELIHKEYGLEVEYAVPWPVEHKDRKVPQSGFYKGKAFYGLQPERAQLVRDIRSFMIDEGINPVLYPEEWLDIDPQLYAEQCMEKPQSVHLSPTVYRRYGRFGWGRL